MVKKYCKAFYKKVFLCFFLLSLAATSLFSKSSIDYKIVQNQQSLLQFEMVPVGDPGNQPDPKTGKGSVDEPFEIGKFEITASQYCTFLNAVAARDSYGLYSPLMQLNRQVRCIERHGHQGFYSYTVVPGRELLPITYVDWYSAARFCNWLEHGQPQGEEGPSTTEQGTYVLNGMTRNAEDGSHNLNHKKDVTNSVLENPNAHWHLPTEDQWYKAAFYKGGGTNAGYWLYPTQSNEAPGNQVGDKPNQENYYRDGYYATRPTFFGSYFSFFNDTPYVTPVGSFTGSPGPYGTFDMGGNVNEWTSDFVVTEKSVSSFSMGYQGSYFYEVICVARLTMGSSWGDYRNLDALHTSFATDETDKSYTVGFRVVYKE